MVAPSHWVDVDCRSRTYPRPKWWLKSVYAVAASLFSTAQGPPPDERLRWLCSETQDFLSHIGRRSRWLFRTALLAVAWIAPLYVLRLGPIAWLSTATCTRALSRVEHSLLATPILAVKAILCIVYYEHPDAAREIGFDGSCLTEKADPEPAGRSVEHAP